MAGVLLVFAAQAQAEYLPGFTLLGTGGGSASVVEARVDREGHTSVIAVLGGKDLSVQVQDRIGGLRLSRLRPGGADRAILFLSTDAAVEWDADVAWIDVDGLVQLLPDNWGYGVSYPLGYRTPTVEEFRKSLATAVRDRQEVDRIAALPPGPARAQATSKLLAAERPENLWYVYFGASLASRLRLPIKSWRDDGEEHTYREEICVALLAAVTGWNEQERTAFRSITVRLGPGEARREHVRLLLQQGVVPADADLFARCHDEASSPRERALAAQALALADTDRGQRVILSELVPERWETALRLLPLLRDHKGEARDRFLDAVDRLADSLLNDGYGDERMNLASALCIALEAGNRRPDLARLLALAQSSLPAQYQALAALQRATGKSWEKDDPRWNALVR